MELLLFGFDALPALFYVLLFVLTARILLIPFSYPRGKFAVATALSGFFGFFLSIIIISYPPFFHVYFFVPVFCFVLAVLGALMCFLLNVNPFFPGERVFKSKTTPSPNLPLSQTAEDSLSEEISATEEIHPQTEKESLALIRQSLSKLTLPYRVFEQLSLKNSGEKLPFHFIVIGPTGIFQIYACNWAGSIKLNNTGGTKEHSFESDIKDFIISTPYRTKMIQNIIRSTGYSHESIHTLICPTYPQVSFEATSTTFTVVRPEELFEQVTTRSKTVPIELSDISEVVQQIQENSEKTN